MIAGLCLLAAHGLLLNAPVSMERTPARARTVQMMAKTKGAKMVTVLLSADVEGIGESGTIVDVKPAYAENVLISKGLGTKATADMIAKVAEEAAAAAAAAKAAKAAAEESSTLIASKFGKAGIVIEAQVGAGNALRETVTAQDVVSALGRAGVKVDASAVEMPEMTELGSAVAELTLHEQVFTSVKVTVKRSPITISYE